MHLHSIILSKHLSVASAVMLCLQSSICMVIEMQSIVLTLYLYLTFIYKFAKENFKKVLE